MYSSSGLQVERSPHNQMPNLQIIKIAPSAIPLFVSRYSSPTTRGEFRCPGSSAPVFLSTCSVLGSVPAVSARGDTVGYDR
jgi:hypothetical protein